MPVAGLSAATTWPQHAFAAPPAGDVLRLEAAGATHPGLVRPTNEDAIGSRIPDDPALLTTRGALFAIADGVGAYAGGEIASQTAVQMLLDEYYSPLAPFQIEAALAAAVHAANLRVCTLAGGGPPASQTTLTALALAGGTAYVAHTGDSRAYLWRHGTLTQLTADHSETAELLRLRLITPEAALTHPRRSVLTRTLGASNRLHPDFQRLAVEPGDGFLLCTDGLWAEVGDATLAAALGGGLTANTDRTTALGESPGSLDTVCARLIAAACEQGGGDNVSLVVVRVVSPGTPPSPPRTGRLARLLAGLRGG